MIIKTFILFELSFQIPTPIICQRSGSLVLLPFCIYLRFLLLLAFILIFLSRLHFWFSVHTVYRHFLVLRPCFIYCVSHSDLMTALRKSKYLTITLTLIYKNSSYHYYYFLSFFMLFSVSSVSSYT